MIVERVMSVPGGSVRFRSSARSDIGLKRAVNEDSLSADAPVFLVADGMGGHARGDIASRTTVDVFREHIADDAPSTPERVLDAVHSSNDAVRDLSDEGDVGEMIAGTTLAGVAFVDAGAGEGCCWMVFNVGDSRVYSWQDGVLAQVSIDHSAVQELVDAGLIDAERAETHPDRNVITRAIGTDEYVDTDVWLLPADGVRSFLICSDGLTKELDDRAISEILAGCDAARDEAGTLDSDSPADLLVAAALEHGGRDNVSVVVVESLFVADSSPAEQPSLA
ncbi:protein phosphatase 2C domain-containing protein [Agromyces atrinae]|uniref:PP2C family protein-serine/threonine phosphatase n=1 Tax=Agromyces atrinae TaxID=592376 RepID=UPI001F5ABAE0|nr:protein phosphatase 2C domain-containing protein [Agromyces atrinae]MCI2959068.1 protein phosphatase 2C domain-containing protein [Agromyces atrinae]